MDKLYEGNSAIILTAVVDPKSTNIEIRNLKVEFDEYVHEGHCKREIKEAQSYNYIGDVEFVTDNDTMGSRVLTSLDSTGRLGAIVLNSPKVFHCQLIFYRPMSSSINVRRLWQYVVKDDMPPVSEKGTTTLWVQDINWSGDDMYVIIAFQSGCFMLFNRLGEPVQTILDITGSRNDPKVFMTVYFTTDPSRARKHGRAYSMAMNKNRQILISDGYTLNILEAETMTSIDELVPNVLPLETEDNDVSIHVSHDTNPLPSEVDVAPKTLNIDKGIFLFRSLIT